MEKCLRRDRTQYIRENRLKLLAVLVGVGLIEKVRVRDHILRLEDERDEAPKAGP